MCAGRNMILKTTDGGERWSALETNLSEPDTDLVRFWFADEYRGWAVGAIDHHPTIWGTSDGGITWSVQHSWPRAYENSTGGIFDIRFVDRMHGWAVGCNGPNAMIVVTTDGGRNWRIQYSGSEIGGQINAVRFSDPLHGWVLFPEAVMQTEDGGLSWHLVYFGGFSLLRNIDAVGPSEVWIAGGWGHLLHGTRNGLDWSEVRLAGKDKFFDSVEFVDKNVGWASGTMGHVFMTRDSGKTWRQDSPPRRLLGSNVAIDEIAITSSSIFMIANPGHLLVRSISNTPAKK